MNGRNARLEVEIAKRMAETELIRELLIHAPARFTETLVQEAGSRIFRAQSYVCQRDPILFSSRSRKKAPYH